MCPYRPLDIAILGYRLGSIEQTPQAVAVTQLSFFKSRSHMSDALHGSCTLNGCMNQHQDQPDQPYIESDVIAVEDLQLAGHCSAL